MPFDGNGIYTPLTPPIFPAVSGTTITANQYNLQILDVSTALSNCMTRDGQGKPVSTIDFNTQKISNLGPAVANSDAVRKDQVATIVGTNGFTLDNTVPLKGKNSGGTALSLLWVGADNMVYLGYSAVGDWFMRFDPATSLITLNKNVRVVGNLNATGDVGAIQP